jgi:hypothetical protein
VYPYVPDEFIVPLWMDLLMHCVPSLLLFTDHVLSRSIVIWRDLGWALVVSSSYAVVLITTTLSWKPMYPDLTFTNIFSYLMILGNIGL